MRTAGGFFDTGTSGKMRIQDAAGGSCVDGERAAGGFDLPRGDAIGRHRLKPNGRTDNAAPKSLGAVDAALCAFPELRFLGLMALRLKPSHFALGRVTRQGAAIVSPSAIFLSWASDSVTRISPLNIPTDAAGAECGERMSQHPVSAART